jgi:hypothetical protein
MSVSAHFNAPTAAALVLGGTAAIVLATVMAFRGSHRQAASRAHVESPAAVSSATPLPSFGGAPSEAEVEYLLDTSD